MVCLGSLNCAQMSSGALAHGAHGVQMAMVVEMTACANANALDSISIWTFGMNSCRRVTRVVPSVNGH
eukprot:SAG31_NODE_875_length_11316_cov_8.924044_10_plen_68_part_00